MDERCPVAVVNAVSAEIPMMGTVGEWWPTRHAWEYSHFASFRKCRLCGMTQVCEDAYSVWRTVCKTTDVP